MANGQTKADVLTFAEEKFERRVSEEVAKLNWMFIFWVGQLGAILGILFAFFRK